MEQPASLFLVLYSNHTHAAEVQAEVHVNRVQCYFCFVFVFLFVCVFVCFYTNLLMSENMDISLHTDTQH